MTSRGVARGKARKNLRKLQNNHYTFRGTCYFTDVFSHSSIRERETDGGMTETQRKTRPDTRHKMRLVCVLFTFEYNTGHTDGPTDGRTDGRTDTTSYTDATAHLKKDKDKRKDRQTDRPVNFNTISILTTALFTALHPQ